MAIPKEMAAPAPVLIHAYFLRRFVAELVVKTSHGRFVAELVNVSACTL
jgi:hypothetical protein